jgi:hypothetical protein
MAYVNVLLLGIKMEIFALNVINIVNNVMVVHLVIVWLVSKVCIDILKIINVNVNLDIKKMEKICLVNLFVVIN